MEVRTSLPQVQEHTFPMNTTNGSSALRASLDKFEVALATPIVAGELADWLGEIRALWDEASRQVQTSLEVEHPRQYQQISKEDQEMFATIEKLKNEDRAIAEDVESFDRLLTRVAEVAPRREPNEE